MAHQKWKLLQVTWLPRDTATWTGWSQMESTGGRVRSVKVFHSIRMSLPIQKPLLSPRVRRVGPSPGGRCPRHATVTSPPRVRRGGSCPEGRRRLQVHLRPTSCLLPSCQTRRTQGVWRGSTCPDDSSDRLWRGVVWTRGDTADTWKSILLRAYEVSEGGVRRV